MVSCGCRVQPRGSGAPALLCAAPSRLCAICAPRPLPPPSSLPPPSPQGARIDVLHIGRCLVRHFGGTRGPRRTGGLPGDPPSLRAFPVSPSRCLSSAFSFLRLCRLCVAAVSVPRSADEASPARADSAEAIATSWESSLVSCPFAACTLCSRSTKHGWQHEEAQRNQLRHSAAKPSSSRALTAVR